VKLRQRLTQRASSISKAGVGDLVMVVRRRSGEVIQLIWWPVDNHGEHFHLEAFPARLQSQVCAELMHCESPSEAKVLLDAAMYRLAET